MLALSNPLGVARTCAVRRPRAWFTVGGAALMGASTVDMLAPTAVVPPIGWAALLILMALLALLDRRRRADAAMTAAAFLVMSLMWLAMAATAPTAGAVAGPSGHLHGGGAPFGVALGVLTVPLAAGLTVIAVRRHGRNRPRGGIRFAELHEPAMSIGMLLMALGMTTPTVLG
ncbi:hypothetical protein ASC66_07800 [Leifsonia sp. Root4]|uniref:hypothetical protein n=1 Tax=Leifsonia sp. Root4 TaxID=1736525 RepID=UPI0006FCB787|nr:hypothetical protein [Leifsonia sp. Root4]KQW06396.1 hypothetical protein ASC66_07800 [Leifsonia sp. Root4]